MIRKNVFTISYNNAEVVLGACGFQVLHLQQRWDQG
jgi:hypothetical protein